MANFKESSRINFSSANTIEHIQTGCLQRIADATELMASNYTQLQNDRDNYKRWYYDERELSAKLYRRISALQGTITRIKNKAK
jgi:hypothetical protein